MDSNSPQTDQATPVVPPESPVADEVIVGWLEEPVSPSDRMAARAAGDVVELTDAAKEALRPRRRRLPLMLFALTCVSTFLAGVSLWNPFTTFTVGLVGDIGLGTGLMPVRRVLLAHWQDGVVYSGAVLAILLAHEMGHFIAARIHRIPASFPYFIPFPISPLGTLGAVIGMDGARANRREIFDIGLAGPIAGLCVAIPVFMLGLRGVDLSQHRFGAFHLDLPLVAHWLIAWLGTPGHSPNDELWHAQINPLLMAGWAGFFVTGLNMLPVSQLDGGHVVYTLFGRSSHWIARSFMLAVIVYMVVSGNFQYSIMVALLLFIGIDHPPTRDDGVPLGVVRTVLGWLSLAIPILCFPLGGIS